jgi:hypothetical protein
MQDNNKSLPCKQSQENFMMNPLLLCCAEMAEVETANTSKRDQSTTQRKDLQIIMILQHEKNEVN